MTVVAANVPAAHNVGADKPLVPQKLPAGHSVSLVMPVLGQ